MKNIHPFFQRFSNRKPLQAILPLLFVMAFLPGCSKKSGYMSMDVYTLNKNIFFEFSNHGKTYNNYGYFVNQQQPRYALTQTLSITEIKDSAGVNYTMIFLSLSEKLQSLTPISLGKVNAFQVYRKPDSGIIGTYRNFPEAYPRGNRDPYKTSPYLFIYNPSLINFDDPRNDTEFNITSTGYLPVEGSYAEGNYTIRLGIVNYQDSITGKFRLYLYK